MTAIIERPRARIYTQEAKKIAKHFYIQKALHLTLRDFHEIFGVCIYIQKHDTMRYATFLYIQKARHFAKSKTICDAFYIPNPALLRYVIFH